MDNVLKMLFDIRLLHGNEAMHDALNYMIENYSKEVEYPYEIKCNNKVVRFSEDWTMYELGE